MAVHVPLPLPRQKVAAAVIVRPAAHLEHVPAPGPQPLCRQHTEEADPAGLPVVIGRLDRPPAELHRHMESAATELTLEEE